MSRAIRTPEESEAAREKREREFLIFLLQCGMALLLGMSVGFWVFDQSPERPTLDPQVQVETE